MRKFVKIKLLQKIRIRKNQVIRLRISIIESEKKIKQIQQIQE